MKDELKRKIEIWVIGLVLAVVILVSVILPPFLAVAGAHRAYRHGLEKGQEGMEEMAKREYLRGFRDGSMATERNFRETMSEAARIKREAVEQAQADKDRIKQ